MRFSQCDAIQIEVCLCEISNHNVAIVIPGTEGGGRNYYYYLYVRLKPLRLGILK